VIGGSTVDAANASSWGTGRTGRLSAFGPKPRANRNRISSSDGSILSTRFPKR